MRFLEHGADIPDELIRAVTDGDVVFLCGAGVSRRVGLPLFKELTEQVYRELGETRDNEPAEGLAFDRTEYDRALRSLEKRTHRPGTPSRVRITVAKLLTALDDVALPDHLALLQLSRDEEGRHKLLTTNFDTLFERAAHAAGLDVPSEAGKSIPKPGGARDHGILHLHGRIRDSKLGLDATDLVLTSADFGDAYLRDGWASQYVEDRMRLSRLVLVGYSAEDAALRLLLETLDADRERFRDLKDIYAIEKRMGYSTSVWKAKGIKPIEFEDYSDLYATLAEWACYAMQPTEYGRARVISILTSPVQAAGTGGIAMRDARKKTPKDATEFEREQLRFFLSKDDVATALAEVNPSLAWLPMLAELKLIDAETHLAPWIEKNFAEAEAIREVAANSQFFGPDTANILEFRLNQTEALPSLMMTCWRLIIHHMRTDKRGALRDEWFDIAPRIKRGERSSELLERLAHVLRPKLQVGKRLSWNDGEGGYEPERPTDLISIDYEIEDHVTDDEVLSAWPEEAPADIDDKLLTLLTHTLSAALEDAIEAGVENNLGYCLSDTDVPSVAEHKQNAYRTGFLPIVRVTADLWTRLARKDTQRALAFVELWRASPFRLTRRLAVFAAADAAVPADMAAEVLMRLPAGELFLAESTVEVYRLIDARWRDFAPDEQQAIERRVVEGPPADWFREDQARNVDRCRFDLLGHLDRSGVQLGANAQAMLDDARKRWPKWELRPKEQAGFHIWSESSSGIVGDPAKLSGVPDAQLISAARKAADEADLLEGDAWQALCRTDGARALRGLAAQAAASQWPDWAWAPFLWAAPKQQDVDDVKRVAQLLLEWPKDRFSKIAADASWWLNDVAKTLDEDLLWPLWDRIAEASLQEIDGRTMNDGLSESRNHPSGRLAEVLLKKLTKSPDDRELPEPLRPRLDKLTTAAGYFGRLARVRLANEVSFLFERAPKWTKEAIIPLFDWWSADAAAAWSARKYANHIGSPELFGLTKRDFLYLFGRADVSAEERRVFADWLTAIIIANQSKLADYPITPAEARSALRQGGVESLSSVGHHLAIEMKRAKPDEKISKWRGVVGPVFQSIWPLDLELQTSASTFKLVQILRASGAAFPEAAEVIVPFIRPENAQHHTSVYSISEADDVLYSSSPERMLDLVVAVVGEARSTYGLRKALERIRERAPQLANTKKFQKLLGLASNS